MRRNALVPGLLGAVALLAGLALLGSAAFLVIEFVAAILALILIVYAVQVRQWWWVPPLAAIAVLWNPVVPFGFAGQWWAIAQLAGAAVFVLVAMLVVHPDPEPRS